jgi:hypothetical protein
MKQSKEEEEEEEEEGGKAAGNQWVYLWRMRKRFPGEVTFCGCP